MPVPGSPPVARRSIPVACGYLAGTLGLFPNYKGSKIGFDCTRPFPYTAEYDRAACKEVSLADYDLERHRGVMPMPGSPPAARRPFLWPADTSPAPSGST
jgi:hypothetical protein